MPPALIFPRGDEWYLLRKRLIRRDKGDTLSLLVQYLLKSWVPCAFPLLPCYSLDYLGWQLLDQPYLLYVITSFHPSLSRFPLGVYNSCAASCASSPLLRPPRYYCRSRSQSHSRPRSHIPCCSRFRPRSRPRSHPVFADGSPPPSPSPSPPHPRSRPGSHIALLRSPPPRLMFPFPLNPCPRSRPRPRFHLSPRPLLQPRSRPVWSFRLSNPATPSVRYACTGTRLCEWSCRVPASATRCLPRWRVRN